MATLFGMVLVAGGIAILAVVRPWRRDDDDYDDETPTAVIHLPKASRPSPRAAKPSAGPRPKPTPTTSHPSNGHSANGQANGGYPSNGHPANGQANGGHLANGHPANGRPAGGHPAGGPSAARRHRVETITRARRVPPAPGREEIMLPEWLGPVSGPR